MVWVYANRLPLHALSTMGLGTFALSCVLMQCVCSVVGLKGARQGGSPDGQLTDCVLPSGHVVGVCACALGVSTVLTATN